MHTRKRGHAEVSSTAKPQKSSPATVAPADTPAPTPASRIIEAVAAPVDQALFLRRFAVIAAQRAEADFEDQLVAFLRSLPATMRARVLARAQRQGRVGKPKGARTFDRSDLVEMFCDCQAHMLATRGARIRNLAAAKLVVARVEAAGRLRNYTTSHDHEAIGRQIVEDYRAERKWRDDHIRALADMVLAGGCEVWPERRLIAS